MKKKPILVFLTAGVVILVFFGFLLSWKGNLGRVLVKLAKKSFDKPVLSELFTLRQAQGER